MVNDLAERCGGSRTHLVRQCHFQIRQPRQPCCTNGDAGVRSDSQKESKCSWKRCANRFIYCLTGNHASCRAKKHGMRYVLGRRNGDTGEEGNIAGTDQRSSSDPYDYVWNVGSCAGRFKFIHPKPLFRATLILSISSSLRGNISWGMTGAPGLSIFRYDHVS